MWTYGFYFATAFLRVGLVDDLGFFFADLDFVAAFFLAEDFLVLRPPPLLCLLPRRWRSGLLFTSSNPPAREVGQCAPARCGSSRR